MYGEEEECIKSLTSDLYPHLTLKYKEVGIMNGLARAINRRISARKNEAFHFNYSMEHGRIYINSPIQNEMVHFDDNLRYALGIK